MRTTCFNPTSKMTLKVSHAISQCYIVACFRKVCAFFTNLNSELGILVVGL